MLVMNDKSLVLENKLCGKYYTPRELADYIVGLFNYDDIDYILEPSCGDGVFIDSFKENSVLDKVKELDAVEIDSIESDKLIRRYIDKSNVSIINRDFFDFYNDYLDYKKYDLVVGNPPYIRYQYLSERQKKYQSSILVSNGMKPNKLINAWVAFMVASIQMLSYKGKIAFVIPSDILQVSYAKELRNYLLNNLSKITIITFEHLIFDGIEQDVLVFIGEKGDGESRIRFIEMSDIDGFKDFDYYCDNFIVTDNIDRKWKEYFFLSNDSIKLIDNIRGDRRFVKMSYYCIVNVGIVTGNNNYFTIDGTVVDKYNLYGATIPLISKGSSGKGVYYTVDDWLLDVERGKKSYLVLFPDIPYNNYCKEYKDYIKFGKDNGEDRRYKCNIRDRWYLVPSVWVPDAFFTSMINDYSRFILNKCNAVSTNNIHRIKAKKDVEIENIVLSYYNSISFAFTEICGRNYGGGMIEITPREVDNIMVPKIDSIDKSFRDELLLRIDNMIKGNYNIERVLDLVDNEILIGILGIDHYICYGFRDIWKYMNKRRLRIK